MKRIALTLISVAAFALAACNGSSDTLTNGQTSGGSQDPNSTAGGENSTFNHSNDPGAADPGAVQQPAEPAQLQALGSPEVTSRMHSCGKMTYTSIGTILNSRGLSGSTGVPSGSQSAMTIYNASSAALSVANYPGRVPEAPFASTSSMAKEFDIFTMASYTAAASGWTATDCAGAQLLGSDGNFTKDGLSCIMGKPATDEHVAIANDAITKNPTDGAKIAIAAVMSAAHTCQ